MDLNLVLALIAWTAMFMAMILIVLLFWPKLSDEAADWLFLAAGVFGVIALISLMILILRMLQFTF